MLTLCWHAAVLQLAAAATGSAADAATFSAAGGLIF